MKKLCLITLVLCLFLGGSNCKRIEEKVEKMWERILEKAEEMFVTSRKVKSQDATLKIANGSGNTVGIDLTNKVPVGGVQFTVKRVKINEVRTTSRTAGFSAAFDKESGKVILVPSSGNEIAIGTGLIAEIICDNKGGFAILSGIKIAKLGY